MDNKTVGRMGKTASFCPSNKLTSLFKLFILDMYFLFLFYCLGFCSTKNCRSFHFVRIRYVFCYFGIPFSQPTQNPLLGFCSTRVVASCATLVVSTTLATSAFLSVSLRKIRLKFIFLLFKI